MDFRKLNLIKILTHSFKGVFNCWGHIIYKGWKHLTRSFLKTALSHHQYHHHHHHHPIALEIVVNIVYQRKDWVLIDSSPNQDWPEGAKSYWVLSRPLSIVKFTLSLTEFLSDLSTPLVMFLILQISKDVERWDDLTPKLETIELTLCCSGKLQQDNCQSEDLANCSWKK